MRKTVIALILVLPLLFVLVIFSSVNVASLGVNISANGIKITNKSSFNNETVEIDLAQDKKYALEVQVQPENATNKDYTFEISEVDGSDLADVSVNKDTGEILAEGEGNAKITAVSNDGGYRDSISVLVNSSAPYDFDVSLCGVDGQNVLKTDRNGNYTATVETGLYSYGVSVKPKNFTEFNIEASGDTVADIEEGKREILLPFSGAAKFDITVPGGVDGDIKKSLSLTVNPPKGSRSHVILNGRADAATVLLESGATSGSFYIECPEEPQIEFEDGRISVKNLQSLGSNRYKAELDIPEGFKDGDSFSAVVTSGGNSGEIRFDFTDFGFDITSSVNLSGGDTSAYIQRNKKVTFYAVPAVPAEGVSFEWSASGVAPELLPSSNGKSCEVKATSFGEFTLHVSAFRNGSEISAKEIKISVISSVNGVRIANSETDKTDLAARYTVGGYKHDASGGKTENYYPLNIIAFNIGTAEAPRGLADLNVYVSDPSLATLKNDGQSVSLHPVGTGAVTVTAEWKGNQTFGVNVKNSLTLNVVGDATEVNKPSEFLADTKAGDKIVLTSDISVGTLDDGTKMSLDERKVILEQNRMPTTYNDAYYKEVNKTDASKLTYIVEFKNDVYGNGHTVDCDAITMDEDFVDEIPGNGNNPPKKVPKFPELYGRPNYFVDYNDGSASVAGQDNCAFLIRTDGVKLYGVNLCACKDVALLDKTKGQYELTWLSCVGTTLDVNASADIINCRIRNGRNVLRIYGGNKQGNSYFIENLSQNAGCDNERATVNIEGCVLLQSREFLLKIGANRALRASNALGNTPKLTRANGSAYTPEGGEYSNVYNLLNDADFYSRYVMTDVTLKNSVLETSGLFTVGVESNFGGNWLYEGTKAPSPYDKLTEPWKKSGGTSFATFLRLKGDVRLYDWKNVKDVRSDTLIEASFGGEVSSWLQLNIGNMLDFVSGYKPETYDKVIYQNGGERYAHGGIAYYGGGLNYSQLDLSGLNSDLADLSRYGINIGILIKSEDRDLNREGDMLPKAAGPNDFNFYMYNSESANSYNKQLSDAENALKYTGVKPVNIF